jgi:hypothetical protein
MSDMLREIQRDMAFMGWKGDPVRGFSHKEDVDGNRIAEHHDATWVRDVEEASARAERLAVIHEIERRRAQDPAP